MIPANPPAKFYTERIHELNSLISAHKRKYNIIAAYRFLTVLTTAIVIYLAWETIWQYILATAIIGLAVFLRLVSISLKLKQQLANLQALLAINQQELHILDGHYTNRPDGLNLQPPHHPYSHDLDIFGKSSIFQYIHRTTSEQGHRLLAHWLLQPADAAAIQERQQAAKELRDKPEWRQQLQAYGFINPVTFSIQQSLNAWLAQPHSFSSNIAWKYLRFGLPAISLGALLLYIIDVLPAGPFYLIVLAFLAFSSYISKLATPQYTQLSRHVAQLETLSQSLQWIGQHAASKQIGALKAILDRMDYRLNPPVFIPLNIFLFWDLQQVLQLEKWKSAQQHTIDNWFHDIATKEALSSLANVSFNHPGWTFPIIQPYWFTFSCREAGHPLIPSSKSIPNDLSMNGHPQLAFITGSNMAGKSTFLRTIGTNLVLAMAGAPVCATHFETPVLKVMTSMRIADNLEESASTFYAELQKLKFILEAVKKQEHPRVFLLLDEILRGTNSLDRHTGSEALIKQLIKESAVGIIASHDLSLAQLQEQFPGAIHNYHFDVTIEGNELSFDYKLKEGVCQTLNATLLMKKIGIEL